jgi:hypothetical protein
MCPSVDRVQVRAKRPRGRALRSASVTIGNPPDAASKKPGFFEKPGFFDRYCDPASPELACLHADDCIDTGAK